MGRGLFNKDGSVKKPKNNLYDQKRWHTHGNCSECFGCGPLSLPCVNDCNHSTPAMYRIENNKVKEDQDQVCRFKSRYVQIIYDGLTLDARSVTQFCWNDETESGMIKILEGIEGTKRENIPGLRFTWDPMCPHRQGYKFLVKGTFGVDLDNPKPSDKADESLYGEAQW